MERRPSNVTARLVATKLEDMEDNYEDIIALPHHVSRNHRPMPLADRAAQFAPFAALTGYEEAVQMADDAFVAKMEEKNEEPLDGANL